jgi:8-oxo-dGTP diphosphatase
LSGAPFAGTSLRLQVVAGVLYDAEGRVLLAQRPEGKFMAGKWEFPGGKLKAGESEAAALRRELAEELGIEVHECCALVRLEHQYPDRQVSLSVWSVSHYSGSALGLEGQALRWVAPAALFSEDLLPADWPIVDVLNQK